MKSPMSMAEEAATEEAKPPEPPADTVQIIAHASLDPEWIISWATLKSAQKRGRPCPHTHTHTPKRRPQRHRPRGTRRRPATAPDTPQQQDAQTTPESHSLRIIWGCKTGEKNSKRNAQMAKEHEDLNQQPEFIETYKLTTVPCDQFKMTWT
jgi:hypothetical protein